MLVLSRKKGERLRVGPDIVITVVRVGAHNVRLGIDAPYEVAIIRDDAEASPDSSLTPESRPLTPVLP